jgi:hypothetical protein
MGLLSQKLTVMATRVGNPSFVPTVACQSRRRAGLDQVAYRHILQDARV